MSIKLVELIRLAGVDLDDYKIHCATGANPTPLETFFDGTFRQWQECQNQKNFQCKRILSLIHLGEKRWLFAGVFDVLGVALGTWRSATCYTYSTREVEGLEHLTGRAVVEFNKTFRASYLRGEKHADRIRVVAIHEQQMTIGDFPGFNSVLLSMSMLETLVRQSNPSWRSALAHIAGVYLIVDTSSGKHYVGSACGGEGIWGRWAAYAKNGHGGNKELRALLDQKGAEHARFLQFSLLEVCDIGAGDQYILARETHWKRVLLSREFGLNKN